MRSSFGRAGLPALFVLTACGSGGAGPVRTDAAPAEDQPTLSPAAQARADSGRPPHTAADVAFMTGMIAHHAQAVQMAGWAPSHGAGDAVGRLSERIAVGQRDEIDFMRRWLGDRRLPVPDADPAHHSMPGMAHPLMPGMLTAEQLTQLDNARGAEFDRLFLTFMIQHHQGALTMVEQLLGARGAARDEHVWKFVSDVNADQTTEIEFMSRMLAQLPPREKSP